MRGVVFKHRRRQNREQIRVPKEVLNNTDRAAWCSSKAGLTMRPGHSPLFPRFYVIFLSHSMQMLILQLYQTTAILFGCFQFSIHQASYHSTPCILDTDGAVKQASKQSTDPPWTAFSSGSLPLIVINIPFSYIFSLLWGCRLPGLWSVGLNLKCWII
jgi:hypothetical protein